MADSRTMYFAEVASTGETFYFYVVQDISFSEGQSIVQKVAPFTAAGRTQNLGRFPNEISKSLMIIDNIKFGTKEDQLEKIMQIKRDREKIRLVIPGVPLSPGYYYIGDVSVKISEPMRLIVDVSFKEILEDNISKTSQNLVLSNSMENIKTLLKQLGLI